MLEDEKWIRTRKSAKHLLAAVVFNESSTASLEETKGTLLACMGYYYVGFHAAVSMLWLCETVPPKELSHVKHSKLKKLVEVHLVRAKKLERIFLNEYNQLQKFREYANYYFGSKLPKYEYTLVAPTISEVTDSLLRKTMGVLNHDLGQIDMVFGFQTTIGDDIGSDLIKLHTGPVVAERVWSYLVRHRFTT